MKRLQKRTVFWGGFGALVLAALAGGAWLERASTPAALPGFAEVRTAWTPSESYLLDRDGELIHEKRTDFSRRRLAWRALEEIAPVLTDTVVAAEDGDFYSHAGIDWPAALAALWGNITGQSRRGASTVTMQLAFLIDEEMPAAGARGPLDKLRQARAALALEARWSKDQILEAYLNLLSYRGELQGIDAAARQLFGKDPSGLQEAEALLLAALLPSPGRPADEVAARACALAARLALATPCGALDQLSENALAYDIAPAARIELAHAVAVQLLEEPGAVIQTTLDAGLQRFVRAALEQHLANLSHRNVRDGAVVVIDNESGEILAYVGSGGPNSTAPQVDGAGALRQAGSTLKPFLYGLAFEKRYLTAASLLDDSPIELDAGSGVYAPENYDRRYKGLVSARTALGNSLNIPAVRTLLLTGIENFLTRLRDLGYDDLTYDAEHYGFSIALGSAEVTLLDQVAAYRVLAMGGQGVELTLMPGEERQEKPVLDPGAAFIVGDILSDRSARAITFGLSSDLATPFWSAVKTGTSKAMRDNWAIGFSGRYTVGVWVGNFEGDSMRGVSGMSGAAPVWREVMGWLHEASPSPAPNAPQGLIHQQILFEPALEPAREEWFLEGTELTRVVLAEGREAGPKITSPLNGLVVALDPDIPLHRQVLPITVDNVGTAVRLTMNGQALPPLAGDLLWTPQPGYHELALLDAEGKELDKVVFTVRQLFDRQ